MWIVIAITSQAPTAGEIFGPFMHERVAKYWAIRNSELFESYTIRKINDPF